MSQPRRLDLEGLRGLAVLLVVGFHAGIPALRGAFVAVDVFFVLSGFFLATSLARSVATGEEIRPGELFARRVWRLLPLLVVVLLGTLATTLLYAPIDRAAVAGHMVPVSLFAGNLAFAAGGVNYFRAGENPLLHAWTLGVELQLALLLPLLVTFFAAWGGRGAPAPTATGAEHRWAVTRRVIIGLSIAGAASFALAVVVNDHAPMWAYFGPHTRLWSFCAGALMAFITGGGQSAVGPASGRVAALQVVGLLLLLLPALLYDGTLVYPGVIALAPVGGTMCLLASGAPGAASLPGRLLSSGPLVAIGRLSFAWYLWHWPLMVLGGVLVPDLGVTGKLAWGAAGLLAAMLTHRWLERPAAVALNARMMRGRPLLAAGGVSLALMCVAMGAARNSERAVNESIHARYQAARVDDMSHGCWERSPRKPSRVACVFGAREASTTIALIGDSHASHWLGGLERAGQRYGWRFDAYVKGACPAADLRGLLEGAAERLYRDCAAFQEETIRRIAAERPQAVLLSNSDNYLNAQGGLMGVPGLSEAVWTEGLRRTYARFDSLGVRVIVMRALPWVPFDVPSCLSRRAAGLPLATACDFMPDAAFMARARQMQDRAARGLDVTFIDMNDHVCGAGSQRCTTERDGTVLYTDDNHITLRFSRSMGVVLGRRLAVPLGAEPLGERVAETRTARVTHPRHVTIGTDQ